MWPVLVPTLIAILHWLIISHLSIDIQSFNKIISLVLQITGGGIILISIDSNIGIVSNSSLLAMFVNYLRTIPINNKNGSFSAPKMEVEPTINSGKLRAGGPNNTIEEKITYLQTQIDWLKDDLNVEIKAVKSKIGKVEKNSTAEISKTNEMVGGIDSKVNKLSIGSLKIQILGVLLMLHGAFSSYYA